MSPQPLKKPRVYAFIDSQNLNLGVRSQGWLIDYKKFYGYLQDVHRIKKTFMFIGHISDNQGLYRFLIAAGYELVFKPTTEYVDAQGVKRVKGNVDTDLVLYAAAIMFKDYDQAVVVSGDGDFLSLYEFLDGRRKLSAIIVPNKKRFLQLLKPFMPRLYYVSDFKHKFLLENKKDGHKSGRLTVRHSPPS